MIYAVEYTVGFGYFGILSNLSAASIRIESNSNRTSRRISCLVRKCFLPGYVDATVLPLLPPVRGLYQIRYTYDKDHTHLLEMLQYLLYTVRYDRMYLDHLENNDKGNR